MEDRVRFYQASTSDLAAMVAELVGYQGEIVYDHSKPDGTPKKFVDVSVIGARLEDTNDAVTRRTTRGPYG
jgi:hypothetical protein